MTAKRYLVLTTAAALVCLGAADRAEAQQKITGGGHGVFVPQASESYELPNGQTVERTKSTAFLIAEDPKSPFHLTNWNCAGTVVTLADDMGGSGSGYCDGVDSDGDVWWISWSGVDGGPWSFLGGTGKFEGVDGGGTWKAAQEWPDGKFMNSWEGTWTMK